MNVGDKLTCKESLIYFGVKNFFDTNKEYEINSICENEVVLIDNFMQAVSLYKNIDELDEDYIWRTFYKPGELRKLKINTII